MNVQIHTALIHHKSGVNLYQGRSKESIRSQIYAYVKDYWADEFDENNPMPEDEQKAIEQYFGQMEERGEWVEYFDAIELDNIQ